MATSSASSPEQQFAAVLHAPLPFLLVSVVAVGVIWFMLNWRFAAKIDRITEERDHYKGLHERGLGIADSLKGLAPTSAPQDAKGGDAGRIATREQRAASNVPANFGDTMSAKYLLDSTKGKTAIKVHDLIRSAVGKPLTVTGAVLEVTNVLHMVSMTISLEEDSSRTIYMTFDTDLDRVRRLDHGQIVKVTGLIKDVSSQDIHLERCSLIM